MVFFHFFWPPWLCLPVLAGIYSSIGLRWIRTCHNFFQPQRRGETTSVPPATWLQVALGFPGIWDCTWMELAFISGHWCPVSLAAALQPRLCRDDAEAEQPSGLWDLIQLWPWGKIQVMFCHLLYLLPLCEWEAAVWMLRRINPGS